MVAQQRPGGISFERQSPDDVLLVEGYGSGGFKLAGGRVEGSLYINHAGFWPVDAASLDQLTGPVIDLAVSESGARPEMILIGTGAKMQLLPKGVREYLEAAGLGYDVMETGAAARTFNVLRLEDRQVGALLLSVA